MSILLLKRDAFFADGFEKGIGLCAFHVSSRDSIHVGIYIHYQGIQEIIHFWSDNDVRIEPLSALHFNDYYFLTLQDFPEKDIISLSIFADEVKNNRLNNLRLNIGAIIYNGGTFNLNADYVTKTDFETVINCGIFVIALFETYKFLLVDWATWPPVSPSGRIEYFDMWLDFVGVPLNEREAYYNLNKEIRGKHVFATARTESRPAGYEELDKLASTLLSEIKLDKGLEVTPP